MSNLKTELLKINLTYKYSIHVLALQIARTFWWSAVLECYIYQSSVCKIQFMLHSCALFSEVLLYMHLVHLCFICVKTSIAWIHSLTLTWKLWGAFYHLFSSTLLCRLLLWRDGGGVDVGQIMDTVGVDVAHFEHRHIYDEPLLDLIYTFLHQLLGLI